MIFAETRLMQLYYSGESSISAFFDRIFLPSSKEWQQAANAAWKDVAAASSSATHFFFITMRPLVLLIMIAGQCIGDFVTKRIFKPFYKHVLVPFSWLSYRNAVIYAKHGWFRLKDFSLRAWQWQRSLTRQQLLVEMVSLLLIITFYYIARWIKQNRYPERAKTWCIDAKRNAVNSYRRFFERLAGFSRVVAAMGPHILFLVGAVAVKLLLPSVITYLATKSYLRLFVSLIVPLILTVDLISNRLDTTPTVRKDLKLRRSEPSSKQNQHSQKEDDKLVSSEKINEQQANKENEKDAQKATKLPRYFPNSAAKTSRTATRRATTTAAFPRTNLSSLKDEADKTPKSSGGENPSSDDQDVSRHCRHSLLYQSESADAVNKAVEFWIEYWTVHAGIEILKSMLYIVPLVPMLHNHLMPKSWLAELDLMFYVWLFVMPIIWPRTLTIEGRPLVLMSRWIRPAAVECHSHVAKILPESFWSRVIVDPCSAFLRVAATLRMLSPHTVETLTHMLQDGRAVVLPMLAVFVPIRFVSISALCYARYILGISKWSAVSTEHKFNVLALKYWCLHSLVVLLMDHTGLGSCLWWIPLSQFTMLLVWWYLTFTKTIDRGYALFEWELVCFHLVEVKENHAAAYERSRTAHMVEYLLDLLPKKIDDIVSSSAIDNSTLLSQLNEVVESISPTRKDSTESPVSTMIGGESGKEDLDSESKQKTPHQKLFDSARDTENSEEDISSDQTDSSIDNRYSRSAALSSSSSHRDGATSPSSQSPRRSSRLLKKRHTASNNTTSRLGKSTGSTISSSNSGGSKRRSPYSKISGTKSES